jgi:hypothetical protein
MIGPAQVSAPGFLLSQTKRNPMSITITGCAQRRTTDYQVARIVELAAGRLRDPHAAHVAELLGCSFEHASKNEFHRRLAILQELHRHLTLERIRGEIGSWLYSPARLEALGEAIKAELARLNTVTRTEADRVFAAGYTPQIEAAVRAA